MNEFVETLDVIARLFAIAIFVFLFFHFCCLFFLPEGRTPLDNFYTFLDVIKGIF